MKYVPHEYQKYAQDFIINNSACALLLDMGLGKTVITSIKSSSRYLE